MSEKTWVRVTLELDGFNPQVLMMDSGYGGEVTEADGAILAAWVEASLIDTLNS